MTAPRAGAPGTGPWSEPAPDPADGDDEPYTGPPPTRPPASWGPPALRRPVPGWAPPGPPAFPPPGPWPPLAGPPPPMPAPPGVRWTAPSAFPPHDEPRTFLQAMRSRTWAWWRPLLGLLLLSVVYAVGAVAVILVALVTSVAPDLALLDLVDPAVLLVTNLSLILFVPVVWSAWAVAHGMRPGWSASVLGRVRWRLFVPYTLLAAGTLGIGIVISLGVSVALDPAQVTGPVDSLGWLLLVVLLTTPLQSAAEEYLFRGYLSQMIAGWIGPERAGAITAALVTGVVFSLAHAPGDVWTFLDRLVFAVAASAVVWLTGGLEAAIVLHAVNNVLVFLLAGALGDGVATAEVPDGAGPVFVLVTTVSMSAYVWLVGRSGERLQPELRTPAQRVYVATAPPWPVQAR